MLECLAHVGINKDNRSNGEEVNASLRMRMYHCVQGMCLFFLRSIIRQSLRYSLCGTLSGEENS